MSFKRLTRCTPSARTPKQKVGKEKYDKLQNLPELLSPPRHQIPQDDPELPVFFQVPMYRQPVAAAMSVHKNKADINILDLLPYNLKAMVERHIDAILQSKEDEIRRLRVENEEKQQMIDIQAETVANCKQLIFRLKRELHAYKERKTVVPPATPAADAREFVDSREQSVECRVSSESSTIRAEKKFHANQSHSSSVHSTIAPYDNSEYTLVYNDDEKEGQLSSFPIPSLYSVVNPTNNAHSRASAMDKSIDNPTVHSSESPSFSYNHGMSIEMSISSSDTTPEPNNRFDGRMPGNEDDTPFITPVHCSEYDLNDINCSVENIQPRLPSLFSFQGIEPTLNKRTTPIEVVQQRVYDEMKLSTATHSGNDVYKRTVYKAQS